MNGLRIPLRRFRQAFGRPSRRCAEDNAQPFLLGQANNGAHNRCLPRARPARNDGKSRLQRLFHGFTLPVRQLDAMCPLLAAEKEFHVGAQFQRRHTGHITYPSGNAQFRLIGVCRIDVRKTAVVFGHELSRHNPLRQDFPQGECLDVQHGSSTADELIFGNADVAVCGHIAQDILQTGGQPFRRQRLRAESKGNLIGRLKADTINFTDKPIRLLLQNVGRVAFILGKKALCIAAGDVVSLQ